MASASGRSPQGFLNAEYEHAPGETTILGAAKVTGKVGKKWTVGLLDALTDREQAWYRNGIDQYDPQQTMYLWSILEKAGIEV